MKKLPIEWSHPPKTCVDMATRRTAPMLAHYGRNISAMPIETLVASCYLQGVEDAMVYLDKTNYSDWTKSLIERPKQN